VVFPKAPATWTPTRKFLITSVQSPRTCPLRFHFPWHACTLVDSLIFFPLYLCHEIESFLPPRPSCCLSLSPDVSPPSVPGPSPVWNNAFCRSNGTYLFHYRPVSGTHGTAPPHLRSDCTTASGFPHPPVGLYRSSRGCCLQPGVQSTSPMSGIYLARTSKDPVLVDGAPPPPWQETRDFFFFLKLGPQVTFA